MFGCLTSDLWCSFLIGLIDLNGVRLYSNKILLTIAAVVDNYCYCEGRQRSDSFYKSTAVGSVFVRESYVMSPKIRCRVFAGALKKTETKKSVFNGICRLCSTSFFLYANIAYILELFSNFRLIFQNLGEVVIILFNTTFPNNCLAQVSLRTQTKCIVIHG